MKNSVLVLNNDTTESLAPDRIIARVRALKDEGCRFITISSTDLGERFALYYHLDKELQLVTLRTEVAKGDSLPSISLVFPAAFLVENEIKDHFGLDFTGLSMDFQGMLYLDDEALRTPFCKIGVTRV